MPDNAEWNPNRYLTIYYTAPTPENDDDIYSEAMEAVDAIISSVTHDDTAFQLGEGGPQ